MAWDEPTEDLLESLIDESQLRHRLHKRCYEHYDKYNKYWTLPIIILSIISGSGNFISQSFPGIEKIMVLSIGGLSVITSMISSIAQFLKLATLSEGNRIAMLSWGKFYSNIMFQISIRKRDRDDCKDFLNTIMGEVQRLQEISPNIPEYMIKKFRQEILDTLPIGFKIPPWFNGIRHFEAYNTPPLSPVRLDIRQPDSIDDEKSPHII